MPASTCASPPQARARPRTTGSVVAGISLALIRLRMKVVRAKPASPSGAGSAIALAPSEAMAVATAVRPAVGSSSAKPGRSVPVRVAVGSWSVTGRLGGVDISASRGSCLGVLCSDRDLDSYSYVAPDDGVAPGDGDPTAGPIV